MISDGALHRFNKDVLYREGKKNCVRSYDEEQKLIGTKIRPPASSWGRHFFVKTTKKFFCIKTLQECRWLLLPPALRLLLLLYWPFTLHSPFLIRYRYVSLSLSLSLSSGTFWVFLSLSINFILHISYNFCQLDKLLWNLYVCSILFIHALLCDCLFNYLKLILYDLLPPTAYIVNISKH